MAFPTKSGGKKSSKFRANRADREHEKSTEPKEGGPRAQANQMQAKKEGNPEHDTSPMSASPTAAPSPAMENPAEEQTEEQVAPGIHDEVKQVMAQHGPAHTINIVHDHEAQRSHVHSVHADGHEHHADHDGPDHHTNAHHHAAHAAGVAVPEEPETETDKMHEGMGGGGEGEEEYGEPL